MADMELLLVYAWWCSLCVWEKGEVFATEGHGKMKRKGLFCHEISKSFLSVFFRGFHGKKTKTRLLALINAKVQCLSLAGLRTQGREPVGSALRGDFPALASVFVPRLFPNTAARQFRILTGFPTT